MKPGITNLGLIGDFPIRVVDLSDGESTSEQVNLYGDNYTIHAKSETSKRGGLLGFLSSKTRGVTLEIGYDGNLLVSTRLKRPITARNALWSSLNAVVDAHHERDPNDAIRRLARSAISTPAGGTAEWDTHVLGTDYTFVTMGVESSLEHDGVRGLLRWKTFSQPALEIVLFHDGSPVERFETGDLSQRMFLDGGLSRLPVFEDDEDIRDQFVADVRRFGVLAHARYQTTGAR